MKHVFSVCFFLLLAAGSLSAQSDDPGRKKLYLHSIVGFHAPNLTNLNAVLEEGGFVPSRSLYFSRGAGFYTVFPKLRLASLFTFSSFSGTRNEDAGSNWLRGTSAGTALGIPLFSNRKLQLIPFAGVVYSWFGTRVASTVPANAATFAGYFAGSPNQYHVTANQFMGNFGLQIAKTRFGDGRLGQKVLLGLRGGYHLPLSETTWKTNDVTLAGSPASHAGGPYLQVVFGFLQ